MNRDDKIRQRLDARLSGIQAGENTAWKVLSLAQKEEKPMKKKASFALILTLALLLAGVALAASLNVFGLFKEDEHKGKQLEKLAQVATTYGETASIPAQETSEEAPKDDYQTLLAMVKNKAIDFTLEQAYADDKTLSISYTLKDAAPRVSYHEGEPTGSFEWLREIKDKRWTDEHMLNVEDKALNEQVKEHLNTPGSRYIVMNSTGLGDGARLTDGTDLPIRDSGLTRLPDGSVQGYMTCSIPDGVPGDKPLEVELIIGYGAMVVYQDEAGYKDAYVNDPADRGMKRLTFTIARNGQTTSQSGELSHKAATEAGSYSAKVQIFLSQVNAKGSVTLKASSAWVDSWHKVNAMMDDASGTANRIFDYVLYAGDKAYPNKDGAIAIKDNGDIVISLDFDAPDSDQNLTLRPIYRDDQTPLAQEAIQLK